MPTDTKPQPSPVEKKPEII